MALHMLRSPRGGNPLRSNWFSSQYVRFKESYFKAIKHPVEAWEEDTLGLKIGYCSKCAEPIITPRSTAEFLIAMMKKVFH